MIQGKSLRAAASVLLSISLMACATPAVQLQDDATGQVVQCGGSRSGSLAGGGLGYQLQKNKDKKCVEGYEALGFKRVP